MRSFECEMEYRPKCIENLGNIKAEDCQQEKATSHLRRAIHIVIAWREFMPSAWDATSRRP